MSDATEKSGVAQAAIRGIGIAPSGIIESDERIVLSWHEQLRPAVEKS
jgi:hypothetical protein